MIVTPVFSGEPDKKLHEKCIYPVVTVVNRDKSGSSTGVVVRSEKIGNNKYHNVAITTAHGLKDKVVVNVQTYKDWSVIAKTTTYPGSTYYVNASADLAAVIFITEKKMYIADLGPKEKLYFGNKIVRVGCGLGDAPRLEEGIITGVSMKYGKNFIHRMSLYTLPGDSGGPVYHHYKIIGFTQSIRMISTNPWLRTIYYRYAMAIRIKDLYTITKVEKGGIDFLIDKKEPLPVFGFFKLKIDYLNKKQRLIPTNPWIDN